ncbi:hypothetical protein HDIA_1970 [Hartmannibacter diazotrophicus]|uniref:Uncharacterized protein n=1 Tax=Hartmannibacter diazotrophicus TaxID=1482074 RepID=A0A2C9D6Y3_9HYPH|nr:hypothetical protein [Hartmannibacter diazotrophicus]SON55511.1 hypothetical protein HDIA_1970 [Hartmannibacter diazotrophicus]
MKSRQKPTIDDQIAEMTQLIERQTNFLAAQVARGQLRQETADWRQDCYEAGLSSLRFVRRYADDFRDFIERKQAFERERAAELRGEGGA